MNRMEMLKDYLSKTPEDPFLQHALAMEYVAVGDDASARDILEKLLAKDPMYLGSYYQLGQLLQRMGAPQQAIEWYRKGLDVAKRLGDRKAQGELQAAYDELADE